MFSFIFFFFHSFTAITQNVCFPFFVSASVSRVREIAVK